MIIKDLLSNEELRQHEFPVARDKVFLAHAGVCAIPRRVSEAMRAYAEQCTKGDQEALVPALSMGRSRELAAKLIQARSSEIAFVGPTSLALSYVASGLRLRKRDNIVVYFDDYPSNVYPWMALAEKGVQVRFLNTRNLGQIRAIDVEGQIDEQTRLVALASCHFLTGYRIEIDRIGAFLRERGILFCVDAIQTLGAFPTSVEHVDFLAADAHKWMLGPCAAGILYVRQEVQERLVPPVYGWHNVRCPEFVAQESIVYPNDARRYEAGSHNLIGLVGLHAAMELLLETGIENIANELLRKRAWLIPQLQSKGYEVWHATSPESAKSGIVTFYRKGTDLAALHDRLLELGIATSLRVDREGNRYIRISPHFYNSDSELHRLVETL